MSGTASVFAWVLFAASVATGRGDDLYSGLTCTVSGYRQIDTVCLRVPKAGGPCKLVSMSPTIISGPSPDAPGSGQIVKVIQRSYTTNFAGSPAKPLPPGTVLPSPDAMEFVGMALKDLGTLTTAPGTAYTDCRLITFQKDAVIVVWTGGVLKIILSDLDAASRQRVESVRGR